jgi:hypothetical protein
VREYRIRAHGLILEHAQEPQALLDLLLLRLTGAEATTSVFLYLLVLGFVAVVDFEELYYLLRLEIPLESTVEALLREVCNDEVGEAVLLLREE